MDLITLVKNHPVITASVIGFMAGFASPFIFIFDRILRAWNKKAEMQEEYEELCEKCNTLKEEILNLEKQKSKLKEELSYKIEEEVREGYRAWYEAWLEQRQKKAEEEIAKKSIEVMKQVAIEQEKVYKETVERLKNTFKENERLKKEIAKLRHQISSLKGKFSNHIITVVRNAKFEILVHALKQRPDRKNIANALK